VRVPVNRTIAAVGISLAALFALGVPAKAQPPPDQKQHEKKDKKQQKAKDAPPDQAKQQAQDKQHGQDKQQAKDKQQAQQQAHQQQAEHQQRQAQHQQQVQQAAPQQPAARVQRLAPQQQQTRISQQQQQLTQYRTHLDQQQLLGEQQSAELQRQNRSAQYTFQQAYVARLSQQQVVLRSQNNYDYNGDPYFYTPASYSYSRAGRSYETNQYGVDLLRQAVNYGYQEGWRAGQADRQDRWGSNYRDSYAYRDANYGYGGFYVDRDTYNGYFREGFRRGYEDGYSSGNRYGRYSNGHGSMADNVLTVILNLRSLR
jgi:hypothetical protein